MDTAQCLNPAAAAFVCGLAEQKGVTPAELIAEAFGLAVVVIDARTANRFRQIEQAAGLVRGGLLGSIMETADGWWANDDGQLEAWVEEGFAPKNPQAVRLALRGLRAKWDAEEAAERHAGMTDDAEEHAATLARIMEADRPANEQARARALQAMGV